MLAIMVVAESLNQMMHGLYIFEQRGSRIQSKIIHQCGNKILPIVCNTTSLYNKLV